MKLRTLASLTKGLGLFLGMGAALFSRAADQPSGTAPAADEQVVKLEKFTVVGSHIPTTETSAEAGSSPVTIIERRTIEQTASENTAELLQQFVAFNQGAIPIANNDTGYTRDATGISLHGIGPDATLVLVDGHRVVPFPVGEFGDRAFADLNTIPMSIIDHFEVATDGASAIYGADAVAGVVNIVLRRHLNGAVAHLSYENTTDKDASQVTGYLLSGISNDKWSLLVGFNYQKRNAIADADREYTLVPPLLSTSSSPINAQITITAYDQAVGLPLNSARPAGVTSNIFFATPGITPGAAGGNTLNPTGLAVSPSTNFGSTPANQYIYSNNKQSVYDYNQSAISLPYWKRYGATLNGDHELAGAPNLKGYFDANYQISRTVNQSAPAPTLNFLVPGLTPLVIPANTAAPFLFAVNSSGSLAAVKTAGTTFSAGTFPGPGTMIDAAGHAQRLAAAGAFNPFNPFNEDISGTSSYRLQEFGNRVLDDTTEAFLGTAGVRGEDLLDKYDFDAGIRYNENNLRTDHTEVSASRFNRILNANDSIFNPASPNYIGTTTPYNPFGYYVNPIPANAAVVRYATIHVHDRNFSSVGNGFFNVDTTHLFELPAGDVGAAAGLDYRVETLDQAPDAETAAGDVIGEVQKLPVDRHRDVWAAYAELRIPIISPGQHIPGVHSLSIDLAGRYEDFLTNHDDTAVPKAGLLYRPFDDSFSLRASASRGFLEPSMFKLYSGGIFSLPSLIDPRNNKTLAEVPVQDVGNSSLKPETSNAYNVGMVWSPQFAPLQGFTTSVDLWRVERNGTALVNNQDTLNNYRNTNFGAGSSLNFNGPGNLPGETVLVDSSGNVDEVVSVYHNAGDSIAEGADLAASYVRVTSVGRFDFAGLMGFLHSFKQASFPGQPLKEQVDTSVDGAGQDAYLRRKVTTTASWTNHGYGASVTGHFLDGFQDYDVNGNPRRVGSSWTWDVQLSYVFDRRFGPYLKDSKISVGSINVLDRNPPVAIDRGNDFSSYPGTIYTSEGRELYLSLDKNF
ncbi:MAG TPA: TonB-dependent receptor [Opitutaceae bacterium]|nr:TonB-dependent receptor [Opitutaceae bacterium]